MSATTDSMVAAVEAIEAALVALGTAYTSYEAGRATAKSDAAAVVGLHAEVIDNALSTEQLCRVIAGRLRAVGAAPILAAGAGNSAQAAEWVAAWSTKIEELVP